MDIRCDYRRWGIGTHAAGIGSGVSITDTLVILACCKWQYIFAVNHNNKAGFFTIEKLFNNNSTTSISEAIVSQHIAYSGLCFFISHGYNNAFTCCETVGFYHYRCTFFVHISNGWLDFSKILIFRRWYVVAC